MHPQYIISSCLATSFYTTAVTKVKEIFKDSIVRTYGYFEWIDDPIAILDENGSFYSSPDALKFYKKIGLKVWRQLPIGNINDFAADSGPYIMYGKAKILVISNGLKQNMTLCLCCCYCGDNFPFKLGYALLYEDDCLVDVSEKMAHTLRLHWLPTIAFWTCLVSAVIIIASCTVWQCFKYYNRHHINSTYEHLVNEKSIDNR